MYIKLKNCNKKFLDNLSMAKNAPKIIPKNIEIKEMYITRKKALTNLSEGVSN
tara:strand:+ start:106 stop:264 length:159 start_codon:yes stop_codon:yes gene_type:complete